jgi:hypothetical protein
MLSPPLSDELSYLATDNSKAMEERSGLKVGGNSRNDRPVTVYP